MFGFAHGSVVPGVVIGVFVPGEHDVHNPVVVVGEPDDESHGVVGDMVMFDSPQVVAMTGLNEWGDKRRTLDGLLLQVLEQASERADESDCLGVVMGREPADELDGRPEFHITNLA